MAYAGSKLSFCTRIGSVPSKRPRLAPPLSLGPQAASSAPVAIDQSHWVLNSLIFEMDSEGQRTSSNPSALLAAVLCKRAKLHEELRNIERQVYDLETSYLQDPGQCGNALKGFEGFLSSSKNTTLLKRSRKFQPEDRLFSLSSVISPAMEEIARDGGAPASGPGKPRRGRGPREAKRRQFSEPDFDYEDDPELM